MKLLLVKLLVSAILLVTLSQAKVIKAEQRKLAGAIFGSVGGKTHLRASCVEIGCTGGCICEHGRCVVPEGKSCVPVIEKCQGNYLCSKSRICNGSSLSKINVKCTSTVECDKGLYCD
jgi:hypothetical protein